MRPSEQAGIRAIERRDTTRVALGAVEFPLLALIVAFAVILLSPLNTPVLPRDEGVFVYIGRGILHGQLPYRDLWDHKGPLIYYLNALGMLVGGGSPWGIWAVEGLMVAAGMLGLYWLLRLMLSRQAALFAITTWLLGFTIVMSGNVVEEYAMLPAIGALVLVIKKPRFAAGCLGLLAGISFLLRPNEAAAPVAAIMFLIAEDAGQHQWRAAMRSVLESALGFTLVTGTVLAYFALNGALGDLVDGMFLFNAYYISTGGNVVASLLAGLGYLLLPVLFALAAFTLAVRSGHRVLTREQQRLLVFAAVSLCITLPLSLLSARSYRHYYISWLLPLTIGSAYFWHLLDLSRLAPALKRPARLISSSILLVAAMLGIRIRAVPLLAGGIAPDEARAIRDIRGFVPADRTLFMWGNETSYAVMADRTISSRFLYLVPLLTPDYGDHVAREVLIDLQRQHAIIIDTSPTDPDVPSLAGDAPAPQLAELYAFVHEHYKVIGTIAGKNWIVWGPEE